jgi:DHA1 family inner membrane transport protein
MVPARIAAPGASFAGLGTLLSQRSVLAVYALTLLYFTAIFTVFSYIGPVLQALAPMGSTALSATLAAFGVSGVVGTLLGGRAGDRFGPRRTLAVQLALLVAMMALLPLTTGHPAAMLVVLLAWGVAGFGMMAPQQVRLAQLAGAQAPLALSLNSSMLYLGTALGATVGGLAAAHIGFERLSWAGAPFAVAGWLLLVAGARPSAPAVSAKIGA